MVTALTLDTIRARKDAAFNRRAELFDEIANVNEEIEDCEASERLFLRINGGKSASTLELPLPPTPLAAKVSSAPIATDTNPYRENTTKYYIWQCLRYSQNRWLSAVEIRSIASNAKREDIPMTSISPMLNAMMNKGYIVRDGLKVALKDRVESKNPATEVAGS